ncbi:DUF1847 domain-containing protein [Chloroflexota bacterium]
MEKTAPQCAKCTVKRCRTLEKDKKLPSFCPTKNYPDIVKESVERMKTDSEVRAINEAWIELMNTVSQNRWNWTRVDEIIEYSKIRRIRKIGIASCFGLLYEARLLTNILEEHDFDVVSVSCVAGEVTPEDVDMVREGIFCNPIMQAGVLNQERTELNIMLGLCVGHDILFLRNSKADVTPLVVRDGALGHNPAAALYLSESYYRNRFLKKS